MNSVIYFAEDGDRVKIGFSRNVEARINQLNQQSGRLLRIIGTVPAGMDKEKALHTVLQEYCIKGEWYRNSAEFQHVIGRCLDNLDDAIQNPDGATTNFAKVCRVFWPENTVGRLAEIGECDRATAFLWLAGLEELPARIVAELMHEIFPPRRA